MRIWKKAARAARLSRKNEIDESEKRSKSCAKKNTNKYFEHCDVFVLFGEAFL